MKLHNVEIKILHSCFFFIAQKKKNCAENKALWLKKKEKNCRLRWTYITLAWQKWKGNQTLHRRKARNATPDQFKLKKRKFHENIQATIWRMKKKKKQNCIINQSFLADQPWPLSFSFRLHPTWRTTTAKSSLN